MRRKKAIRNIFFSFLLEGFSLISGLIIPKVMISAFGSETNGMVNSIASFVGYIALLQSGMGSVAKAALYKPLAEKDSNRLNTLIATIESFFRKIAFATIVYVLLLSWLYPTVIARQWDFLYVASLVIIIGIGTIAQYYFGITYQMLVEADQNSYIYSIIQSAAIVLNALLVVFFVKIGSSIQTVSASVFLLRPVCLNLYVRKKYRINTKVPQDKTLLNQRWDGFMQAIAYFIHSKTDVLVLTLLSSFTNVSIYGVYAMINTALAAMVKTVDKAMGAVFGNIYALSETNKLKKSFQTYTTLSHMITTILFSTAAVTACSFVDVYTREFSDANYVQPIFSIMIISAEMVYCLRLAYNSLIYAAGKFRETRNAAIIEAIINIVLSCILVPKLGLVGVAAGTLIAMVYRNIHFICFLKNNIVYLNLGEQIKRYAVSVISYGLFIIVLGKITVAIDSYLSWLLYASAVFVTITILTLLINYLFYKEDIRDIFSTIRRKRNR